MRIYRNGVGESKIKHYGFTRTLLIRYCNFSRERARSRALISVAQPAGHPTVGTSHFRLCGEPRRPANLPGWPPSPGRVPIPAPLDLCHPVRASPSPGGGGVELERDLG